MKSSVSGVQSVDRAFAILAVLGDGPLGVTEIADRAGLPKSTAARLLSALVARGAVERTDGSGYRLGPWLATLAASVGPTGGLVALARPSLVDLADATGEAAGLSIPDGELVHYVDQVASGHPVAIRDWTGTRLPMHAVSAGIAILAHRHPDAVERLLAKPLERFTEATVTDPALVRERIRRARLDGFAWTRDEIAEGISSVAAPIVDDGGAAIGAIHLHGPSYRFPPADPTAPHGQAADGRSAHTKSPSDRIAAEVVGAAARVSARLRHIR